MCDRSDVHALYMYICIWRTPELTRRRDINIVELSIRSQIAEFRQEGSARGSPLRRDK